MMSTAPLVSLDLEKLLSTAQLPALPQSAIRLLELSKDPSNGPNEFAVALEVDPGLAGQVLRFVNSSYFGFSGEISSVKLAITLVGVRTIKNFALWSAVFSLMPNPKCGPFDLKLLWQDALRRALFARTACDLLGQDEAEEAFSAALLQDMAVPILAKEKPDLYQELLGARKEGSVRLSALEQRVFGWNHATAGSKMARRWNLPEAFTVLIEHHLEIDALVARSDRDPSQTAVALSALLPAATDPTWEEAPKFEAHLKALLGDDHPPIVELLGSIDEAFSEFAPLLQLDADGKSLVDYYQEATSPA